MTTPWKYQAIEEAWINKDEEKQGFLNCDLEDRPAIGEINDGICNYNKTL